MVAMPGDVGEFVEHGGEVENKGPQAVLDFINRHIDQEP